MGASPAQRVRGSSSAHGFGAASSDLGSHGAGQGELLLVSSGARISRWRERDGEFTFRAAQRACLADVPGRLHHHQAVGGAATPPGQLRRRRRSTAATGTLSLATTALLGGIPPQIWCSPPAASGAGKLEPARGIVLPRRAPPRPPCRHSHRHSVVLPVHHDAHGWRRGEATPIRGVEVIHHHVVPPSPP
jgi:hypothetical protein